MRYSQLFGKTLRSVSKEVLPQGNALLHQAGFIRESTAGRYYFLPLGMRVREKVCAIIDEEMDRAGAQRIMTPVLHPIELWEESRRTAEVSFELLHVRDRRERTFVLGGTAEEMLVDLVRKVGLSYRDLPVCLYQFSQKFRDELRARGGLLRTREFLMKDAYSFHATKEDFELYYARMSEAYSRIFSRLGLTARKVAADNGYMGGEYCHEFVVEHAAGESRFLMSEDGSYAAHEDVARFVWDYKNSHEQLLPMLKREAKRGPSVKDGVALYGEPAWRWIKTIVYCTDSNEFILASLRGDLEVNEVKLCKALGATAVRLATEDEVASLGSVVGFVSPLKLSLRKVGDLSLESVRNFYTGADEFQLDTLNVNLGRDFTVDVLADIANAPEDATVEGISGRLMARTGIEVGNIFQLGTHYSERMRDCSFTDADGRECLYYMGCYGIGVDRTIATIAEVFHDERGLLWPDAVAPFQVHLVSLCTEAGDKQKADETYNEMASHGIEVLYDDRAVSAGVKFADADLIGIPHRVIISRKTLEQERVEYKPRSESRASQVSLEEVRRLLAAAGG